MPGVNNAGMGGGVGLGMGVAGNGWGETRDLRSSQMGLPLDMRGVDPLRVTSVGEPRDLRILDPREPMRGDPRGISGRLNGNSEMWGQHHPIAHNQMPGLNKIVGPSLGANGGNVVGSSVAPGAGVAGGGGGGVAPNMGGGPGAVGAANNSGSGGGGGVIYNVVWGAPPPIKTSKDLNSVVSMGAKPSGTGWEEPSPPPQRRNIPNYDDGTSLWSQQSRVPGGGGGSHWKDVSDPRNHIMRNSMGGPNSNTNPGVVVAGGGNVF